MTNCNCGITRLPVSIQRLNLLFCLTLIHSPRRLMTFSAYCVQSRYTCSAKLNWPQCRVREKLIPRCAGLADVAMKTTIFYRMFYALVNTCGGSIRALSRRPPPEGPTWLAPLHRRSWGIEIRASTCNDSINVIVQRRGQKAHLQIGNDIM